MAICVLTELQGRRERRLYMTLFGSTQLACEESAQRLAVRRLSAPVVLEILGHMMFRQERSGGEMSHHGMQVTTLLGIVGIGLFDSSDGDIERIVLVVVRPVLKRDNEVAPLCAKLAFVDIIHRHFFIRVRSAVARNDDQVAHRGE